MQLMDAGGILLQIQLIVLILWINAGRTRVYRIMRLPAMLMLIVIHLNMDVNQHVSRQKHKEHAEPDVNGLQVYVTLLVAVRFLMEWKKELLHL